MSLRPPSLPLPSAQLASSLTDHSLPSSESNQPPFTVDTSPDWKPPKSFDCDFDLQRGSSSSLTLSQTTLQSLISPEDNTEPASLSHHRAHDYMTIRDTLERISEVWVLIGWQAKWKETTSSFKVPNEADFQLYVPVFYTDGTGSAYFAALNLTKPAGGKYLPLEIKLVYTPETGEVITLSKTGVQPDEDGIIEDGFDITIADKGNSTVFQHGVKYTLTQVSAGEDSRAGTIYEEFVAMFPTLSLTYTAASLIVVLETRSGS
ncbi:hypothetical protein BLNAU_11684 [Blattamonas nauphoetae]|uniref:Uncharacterized protein n=1 Tax=Blattamonas nauphoetae TaxID=2049346 RepID=A0ABQ9XLV2_9EUKA|nr:hypothetical protein BLNAU_11684 [Blattamonas nauphoetae]